MQEQKFLLNLCEFKITHNPLYNKKISSKFHWRFLFIDFYALLTFLNEHKVNVSAYFNFASASLMRRIASTIVSSLVA